MLNQESGETSYVIFSLHGLTYGVDAMAVKEIFSLPELAIAIDAPDDIVGLLNLRGKLVPVMDLSRRFGYPFQEYKVGDAVIAIEQLGEMVGIVVNQVREVILIASEAIEGTIYARHSSKLIRSVAKLGSENIALLKIGVLFDHADVGEILSTTSANSNHLNHDDAEDLASLREAIASQWVQRQGDFFDTFCPHATEGDRQIFRNRAKQLMQASQRNDLMGLRPLAVVGLGDEYFG